MVLHYCTRSCEGSCGPTQTRSGGPISDHEPTGGGAGRSRAHGRGLSESRRVPCRNARPPRCGRELVCVRLGVKHVGSVGLPVIRRHRPGGRSVIIYNLHEVCWCLRPHTILPLPCDGRGGFNSPARKQAHFPGKGHGTEGTRAREMKREPTPRVSREVEQRAGAFPHHPFRGREATCEHIQAMWGQQGPPVSARCGVRFGSWGRLSPAAPCRGWKFLWVMFNCSLKSPFQWLSNGARGDFCGWFFPGLRSIEFGFI